MRCLTRIAALLALTLLTGCTSTEPTPTPVPEPKPKPPPALTSACPLLNASELATALGGQFTPEERPSAHRGGGTQYVCVYRGSTVDLVLTASDAPRNAESPARFVSSIARTDPAAQQVSGLGETAAFIHLAGGDVQVLLGTAKYSQNRFRGLTLALSTGDDAARKPLTTLAKKALSRM